MERTTTTSNATLTVVETVAGCLGLPRRNCWKQIYRVAITRGAPRGARNKRNARNAQHAQRA
eukprot:120380-Lingulodinium_polyedra.AAC.1